MKFETRLNGNLCFYVSGMRNPVQRPLRRSVRGSVILLVMSQYL